MRWNRLEDAKIKDILDTYIVQEQRQYGEHNYLLSGRQVLDRLTNKANKKDIFICRVTKAK